MYTTGQGRAHRDLGPRRRHGRQLVDGHQERRPALGAGRGRDAPGAGAQRPALQVRQFISF